MRKPRKTLTAGIEDKTLLVVLRKAWRSPFTLSCDFARQHTAYIAMAACKGLITTRVDKALYGQRWLITPIGLQLIRQREA